MVEFFVMFRFEGRVVFLRVYIVFRRGVEDFEREFVFLMCFGVVGFFFVFGLRVFFVVFGLVDTLFVYLL